MSVAYSNLINQGVGRIVGKPKRSYVFEAHIGAALRSAEEFQLMLLQLYNLTSIDNSEGIQLDNIGWLIGQPRRVEQAVEKWFFGFDDQDHAYTFTEDSDPTIGGPFYNDGESTTDSALLDDNSYRLILKARVVRNNARSGEVSFVNILHQVLELIIGSIEHHVLDVGGMHIEIGIGVIPTDMQEAILLYSGVLPISMGVSHAIVVWDEEAETFGFDDTPGDHVATFAEDEVGGGVFAEEIT